MSRAIKLLQEKPFSILVSPPENSVDFVGAAIDAGADAVKLHINLFHPASKRQFGSFAEERRNLECILETAGDFPVGLVPGADSLPSHGEFEEILQMGFDFIDLFTQHYPNWLLKVLAEQSEVGIMAAIASSSTPQELPNWEARGVQAFELAFTPQMHYGQPLTTADITCAAAFAVKALSPCILPTQKAIRPGNLQALSKAGVRGVVLGAVVTGLELTGCRDVISEFALEAQAV